MALEVEQLSKDYPTQSGPLSVVRGVTLRLDRGDTLVLLTDGILEAQEQDGARPGTRVVLPLLARERALPPRALARALCEDVLRRGGDRIQDDMTVFVLRNPGGRP